MTRREPPGKTLLHELREAAGLTQEEVAARAGLSVRGLSNLERGVVDRPRRASLEALAGALGLTERDRRRLVDSFRAAPADTAPTSWLGPRNPLRELVGREAELAELRAALRTHDLVTVTGPGGCGKTALALSAAAGHHVTVLALAALTSAGQILPALATTLQVRVAGAEATLDGVEQALSGPGRLLVVDNAEHLAGAVAALLARLRGGCPSLTVLVTSREPLGLSEELVWQLRPLRIPTSAADSEAPAAVLFRRRARAAAPAADLSDAEAVARICRRLDGLPLALELAAARVRALPVPAIADRLDRGEELLTSAAPGSRTLEETIDWSYRLLEPAEQQALAQLSVFRGPFGPDAVEAVVAVDGDPVALAAQLVDRSLLQVEPGGRYAMLGTIAGYAARRLTEPAATRARHLDWWLERGRRLAGIAGFGDRLAAARVLAADLADAEHALAGGVEAGRVVDVVRLAHMLETCWNAAPGYAAQGARWLALVDDPAGACCPPRLRALARTSRGQLLSMLGDQRGALAVLQAALPDAGALAQTERLDLLGMIAQVEVGQLDPGAVARTDELLAAAAGCEPGDELAATLGTVVQIELEWGRTDRAEAASRRVGELVRTTSGWMAAPHRSQQARLAALRGDTAAARAALDDALAGSADLGWARWFLARLTVAEVLLALDAPEEAYDHLAAELPALVAAAPELTLKAGALRVPMAEALRRLGRPGAPEALRAGLESASGTQSMGVGFAAALVTAAALKDVELAERWQRVRLTLGLPVPPAYRRTALDAGLDLRPGDPAQARAASDELAALLTTAAAAIAHA